MSGRPKNLPQQPPESYATNYLKPREKYVLIQMESKSYIFAYNIFHFRRFESEINLLSKIAKSSDINVPVIIDIIIFSYSVAEENGKFAYKPLLVDKKIITEDFLGKFNNFTFFSKMRAIHTHIEYHKRLLLF